MGSKNYIIKFSIPLWLEIDFDNYLQRMRPAAAYKIFRSDLPKNEYKEVAGNMDCSRVMKSDARSLPASGKLESKEKEICQVKEIRKGSGCRDSATDIKKVVKETVMVSGLKVATSWGKLAS